VGRFPEALEESPEALEESPEALEESPEALEESGESDRVHSPPWIVLPGERRPFSNVQVVVFFILLTRVDARAVPAKIGERLNEQTSTPPPSTNRFAP
jgi:hypothetical protein